MDEIEYEIWKEFETLSNYDVDTIHNNVEIHEHFGLPYHDRLNKVTESGYSLLDKGFLSVDRKIDNLLNQSSINWNEIKKLYPEAPYKSIDPWQIDWIEKRKMLHKIFFDEKKAIDYFISRRWPNGIICPKCGCPNIRDVSDQWNMHNENYNMFYCLFCHKTFSPTVGTILQNTKITYIKWLSAVYLLTSAHSNTINASAFGRALNITHHSSYYIFQKIKKNVGNEFLFRINKGLFINT